MSDLDAPPVPPESERHIVITVSRVGPLPHEVTVTLDLGELDAIAGRAYIEVALLELEAGYDEPAEVEDE
jgi:hypothetical protein